MDGSLFNTHNIVSFLVMVICCDKEQEKKEYYLHL